MVSSKLSSKTAANKKPVVCLAPPVPPIGPLELTLVPHDDEIYVDESIGVTLWANHPSRPAAEPYQVQWTMNYGSWDDPPNSLNRIALVGTWRAPSFPCTAAIKVTATWPDAATLFTYCTITVITS